MATLSFKKLRKANNKRRKLLYPHCETWIPEQWGNATAGEMGEACNKIKKRFGRRNKKIKMSSIAEELADTVIYLDQLANSMDIDLEDAIVTKFNQVSKKKKCTIEL